MVILPDDVAIVTAPSPVPMSSAATAALAYEFICEALIYFVVPPSSTRNLSVSARVIDVPSVAPST